MSTWNWKANLVEGLWSREALISDGTSQALDVDVLLSELYSTSYPGTFTLAHGIAQQAKLISAPLLSYPMSITPIKLEGGSVINFANAFDGCLLKHDGVKWVLVSLMGKATADVEPLEDIYSKVSDIDRAILGAIGRSENNDFSGSSEYTMSDDVNLFFGLMNNQEGNLTVPAGVLGQLRFVCISEGSYPLNVIGDTLVTYSKIELTAPGDSVILRHEGDGWHVVDSNGDAQLVR